jgi:hypothetical protein
MREIDFNELPRYSPWPARLLGLEPWTIPTRDVSKVSREYDEDKYAGCLAHYNRSDKAVTPDDVRWFEYGLEPGSELCIAVGEKLYVTSLGKAREKYERLIVEAMSDIIESANTVVELGSGYGYNLWVLAEKFPGKEWRGGDYSQNAVRLGSRLFKSQPNIEIYRFNFYEPGSYGFIASARAPVVVFTAHSIEQLPSSAVVFDALREYGDKICAVFHFEPVYELQKETLLGMMRRRYAEVNDYNRDLLTEIRRRPYIRVSNIAENVIGLNPLNPTSTVHWEFVL